MNSKYKHKHLRVDTPGTARFLTFGCFRHKFLFNDTGLCHIFLEQLDKFRNSVPFELCAYVIMPNHVHVMLFASEGIELRKQIGVLKRQSGFHLLNHMRNKNSYYLNQLKVNYKGKETFRFWQYGGGHDHSISDREVINKGIEYIHNNPVKAGIIGNAVDYQWSSAKAWLEGLQEPIAINPDTYYK